jgi:hypothetical protein
MSNVISYIINVNKIMGKSENLKAKIILKNDGWPVYA